MDSISWLHWALLSAVFAALTAILAKAGLAQVDADAAMWVRTLVITAAMTAFVLVTGKIGHAAGLSARTLALLAASGLATGASWMCYFRALKLGEASKVAPIDKLSVVLVAVAAFVFLGERPTSREWLGIAMVGAGVVILSLKR